MLNYSSNNTTTSCIHDSENQVSKFAVYQAGDFFFLEFSRGTDQWELTEMAKSVQLGSDKRIKSKEEKITYHGMLHSCRALRGSGRSA